MISLPILLAQEAASQVAASAPKNEVMSWLDVVLFCVAVVGVIGLGIYKSSAPKKDSESEDETKSKSAADYFLAGRGLSWWLVGFSLIAANISTEQFVGMSGQAADWLGLAIAGYEWLAAITLVVVAFFFLPKLLRCGVYTVPEFLEVRFNLGARTIIALSTLLILVGVPTAGVIFAGAKCIAVFFFGAEGVTGLDFGHIGLLGTQIDGNILFGCVVIAACAAVYVFIGGLKACAWTDLIWGSALILGGGVVAYFAVTALGNADPTQLIQSASANSGATVEGLQHSGGIGRFLQLNAGDAVNGMNSSGGKLHMIRPLADPSIPWTALILGLWIPNFFYWGLNQYIMQRTLASRSVAEGQMGIVFAAFLKLIVPFVVVIPGIMAYNLFRDDLKAGADTKNTAEINRITQSEEANSTIYFVTGEFLLQNCESANEGQPSKAEELINHNIEVAALPEEKKAEIENALATLCADVKNENTTLAQRIPLAQKVADLNMEIMEAADSKNLKVSNKLVGFDYDSAFPTLLRNLMKPGITWFVLAALFGAVVSSLASMLNSASTIFTMDIYHKLVPAAAPERLVTVGKIGVVVCVLIAMALAPFLNSPVFGGIFNFIQEFQGFISPGVLCVFLFGFFVPKCPRVFGWLGILINAVLYGLLKWVILPDWAFLNRMSVCLIVCILTGAILTLINSARGGQAIDVPAKNEVPLEGSGKAKVFGAFVVIATIALYTIFW